MRTIGSNLMAVLVVACGGAQQPAVEAPAGADGDAAAAQDARAQVERTMNAFAAMDVSAFEAGLAEDVTAFEMDMEGHPLRLGSHDEVVRFARDVFTQVQGMRATLSLDIQSNDCRATAAMAWCIVQFDFKASMPDGSSMVQPSRNTVVLRRAADGWRWSHWHSSMAVAPAPAVASPPAATP